MFSYCDAIIEMDLSNFQTSSVGDMGNMFCGCSSLKSIDLSNINTARVEVMAEMFKGCISLTTLDLSNFNVRNVKNMGNMFTNCKSLKTLNLNSFYPQSAQYVDNLLKNCESLHSVYFTNFRSANVLNMDDMFLNCKNLEYVNLENYSTNRNKERFYYFPHSKKNLVVCTKDTYLKQIIERQYCNVVSCATNWYDYQKKVINGTNECTTDCNSTNYKYEYNSKCYSNCLIGTYNNNFKCENWHQDCKECEEGFTTDNSNCITCLSSTKYLYLGNFLSECPRGYYSDTDLNQKVCKCELIQCYECTRESLKQNLCTICETDDGYYPVYGNSDNPYSPYYNCSKPLEGFYLDEEISVYKYCYLSCKTCNIDGNEEEHNCIQCKPGYNFEMHFIIYKNCYEECPNYNYYDEEEQIWLCTKEEKCPENYDKLIEPKKQCIDHCTKDDMYQYEFKKKCYEICPSNSIERENNTILFGSSIFNRYFCKPICYEDSPFEIMITQNCVQNCEIKHINDL